MTATATGSVTTSVTAFDVRPEGDGGRAAVFGDRHDGGTGRPLDPEQGNEEEKGHDEQGRAHRTALRSSHLLCGHVRLMVGQGRRRAQEETEAGGTAPGGVSHAGRMLLPSCEKPELIEVVRLTDPVVNMASADLIGEDVALWTADQAREALRLIAAVPDDEVHRCFLPGWGIRAHSSTGLLFRIAFCYRCHGARLWGPSVPPEHEGLHGFAPESPAAVDLLRRFRAS